MLGSDLLTMTRLGIRWVEVDVMVDGVGLDFKAGDVLVDVEEEGMRLAWGVGRRVPGLGSGWLTMTEI